MRYTTQNAADHKPTRVLRPRTLIYGSLLSLLIGGFAFAVATRELIELDVLRDRNALYRTLDDGRIENVYTVRIINKDGNAHELKLQVEGLIGAQLDSDTATVRVGSGSVVSVPVRVRVPSGSVSGSVTVEIVAEAVDGSSHIVESKARFIGPVSS